MREEVIAVAMSDAEDRRPLHGGVCVGEELAEESIGLSIAHHCKELWEEGAQLGIHLGHQGL